jgi:two-component system chemotaxis sensor kinase CheA
MTSEEIQAIFFVECEESLAAAEAGLAACRAGTQDADTVNAVFRAVHSIKGGAGAFGFEALQAYTHIFETLLSDVRDGTVPIDEPLVELLLRALDTLSDHVTVVREGGDVPDDAALIAAMTAALAENGGGAAAETPAPVAPPPALAVADETASTEDASDPFDLDALLDSIAGDCAPAEAPGWQVHLRPHAGAMVNGGEPLLLLRELSELGGHCVACDVSAVPPLDAIDPRQGYLGWTFEMPATRAEGAVRDVFDFVGDDCGIAIGGETIPPLQIAQAVPATPAATPVLAVVAEAAKAAPIAQIAPKEVAAGVKPSPATPAAAPAAGQSIRIDLIKLDRLIDTVGELVIAQAMLAQRLGGSGMAATEELALLEGLTRDIQESAMAIRAQPIGTVFSRVPRILRELASSTGKQIRLELSGEATELDKTVIERLGEPLTHLIRNAVDHGIEDPAERVAAGKSAEGTLRLSAEHRSGRILIRISDDGRGIDRARVMAKAIEKGLIAPDAQLSGEEIDNLIFAAGFSTAAVVSSISGRGVGMDVVRQNVKELGGRITIDSEGGKGTTFTLTLPLTLAISDGMVVNVGDQTLVVPLAHVVESLRPDAGDVQGLGASRQMINMRGKFIPVLSIHHAIGAGGPACSPEQGVLIVVDTESAGQAALLVDAICDQRQVVIKSLDTHYRAVEGVAGATILGDGRVALILDVDDLVTNAMAAPDRQAA